MRRFNNTRDIATFTFQVGLTTLFVAGTIRLIVAIVMNGLTQSTFGILD